MIRLLEREKTILPDIYRLLGISLCQKQAADQEVSYSLQGMLYLAKTNWLLLGVPNDLGVGVFKALAEPGIELPLDPVTDRYNAHISVMTAEEVERIGPDKITERGKTYSYSLGRLVKIPVRSRTIDTLWAISVHSPELQALRISYGLSPFPQDRAFHITCAIRRPNVLGRNEVAKSD